MNSRTRMDAGRLAMFVMSLSGTALLGCSGTESDAGALAPGREEAVGTTSQALWPDSIVEKTLVPLRALDAPTNVYLTAIDQRVDGSGTFKQIFHVYQPDTNGEGVRFEVAAKTSTGAIDGAHQFQSVKVTSRPGASDQTQQTLWNSTGQGTYHVSNSRQGWYRFEFTYVSPNAGRTLTFRALDDSSSSLKIVWSDPPSARVQVRATVQVLQRSQAYLKGGAYRTADASQSAFADSITVDGRLLYRRSFDQGQFNFPLGSLSAGAHTVEFSLQANSYNPAKFWFRINEKTFDPLARYNEWRPVQFLYYGETRTADYDAWNDGVAFAQGAEPGRGVRPAPVRRGTSLGVAIENPALAGFSSNARLRVFRQGSTAPLNWTATLQANGDYPGGIYSSAGFQARNREHWRIAVPANAPVGRYVLNVTAPNGAQIGSNVAFYVIHNPFPLVAGARITKAELSTYGYDEDEDGVNMGDEAFGSDADAQRDHFTAIYYGAPHLGEFSPDSKVTGAFRRTSEDGLALSVLDYAMAAADGTTTEFDTMRRVLRLASQRYRYGGSDRSDDTQSLIVSSSDDAATLAASLADSALYAKPGNELVWPGQAVCYTMASLLPAYARAAGIPARSVTAAGLGGWAEHAFAEVFIPDLPRHGGTTTSSSTSPNSDTDPWYVFDATDPAGTDGTAEWQQHSQALSPRAQYGRAYQMIKGFSQEVHATTTPVVWSFFDDGVLTTNALSVTSKYASGPDFWLSRSGITGWLGFWERDVYRVSTATTGASRVSVRTLPNDGEYLQPRLCVAPVTANPPMPERCASPATSVALPPGESYVVVFNGTEPLQQFRGDSVQYVLELQ